MSTCSVGYNDGGGDLKKCTSSTGRVGNPHAEIRPAQWWAVGMGERLEMQKQWHSHNYHHHSHHHHLRDQLELFIPRSVKKKVKRQRGLS